MCKHVCCDDMENAIAEGFITDDYKLIKTIVYDEGEWGYDVCEEYEIIYYCPYCGKNIE